MHLCRSALLSFVRKTRTTTTTTYNTWIIHEGRRRSQVKPFPRARFCAASTVYARTLYDDSFRRTRIIVNGVLSTLPLTCTHIYICIYIDSGKMGAVLSREGALNSVIRFAVPWQDCAHRDAGIYVCKGVG